MPELLWSYCQSLWPYYSWRIIIFSFTSLQTLFSPYWTTLDLEPYFLVLQPICCCSSLLVLVLQTFLYLIVHSFLLRFLLWSSGILVFPTISWYHLFFVNLFCSSHSLCHMCFILCLVVTSPNFIYRLTTIYLFFFARWAPWHFTKCYNLRLSSGCNLGKDLSKE